MFRERKVRKKNNFFLCEHKTRLSVKWMLCCVRESRQSDIEIPLKELAELSFTGLIFFIVKSENLFGCQKNKR